jgi:hypothetical protein
MYAPINILDILIWSVIVGVTSFISEQNIYHKKKKNLLFLYENCVANRLEICLNSFQKDDIRS